MTGDYGAMLLSIFPSASSGGTLALAAVGFVLGGLWVRRG